MTNKKGKSICIYSTKGGVGKSITALNLAGVFVSLKQNILIIDLDTTSGAIATYLNKDINKTIYDFMDDYTNNRSNKISDYATKYNDNISFIASCKDPRQGSKIESNYVTALIEKASFEYDVVIVDTNHKIDEFNINILDNCDETLLILSNDLLDIKNMCNLITIFKDAEKTNYKILLNECISLNKNYYSLYDIKNIINTNIDYYINNSFYIKTLPRYVADGEIITLNPKMTKVFPKVYKTYVSIYNDLMEVSDEK